MKKFCPRYATGAFSGRGDCYAILSPMKFSNNNEIHFRTRIRSFEDKKI